MRELDLIGRTLVAVDGALFHGNASKGSIFTKGKLAKQIAELDREIDAYGKPWTRTSTEEARQQSGGPEDGSKGDRGDVGEKMKELMARRERAQADLEELQISDKGQVSKTDPDARLLSKGDQTIAGYNVQSVVDDKHLLIVASEVVNRSDAGHLHRWQKRSRMLWMSRRCRCWPMTGYYSSEDLKACEDDGITAYVPIHEGNRKLEKQGRFPRRTSVTRRASMLSLPGRRIAASDKEALDECKRPGGDPLSEPRRSCDACPMSARCLGPKERTRSVFRWEHEAVWSAIAPGWQAKTQAN